MQILIVEDNEDAAESLALLLKLGGHDVQTAADGRSALQTLERSTPDAVLVDIGLPGMSGYELAEMIRSSGRSRGALLVAVSGYGSTEDKAKSAHAGFDAHLVKPLDFRALSKLLASRGAGNAHGAGTPERLALY